MGVKVTTAAYIKAKSLVAAYEAEEYQVRLRSLVRSLAEHLYHYVPEADARYLAMEFGERVMLFGTFATWGLLVYRAKQIRADQSVAGLPVTDDTIQRHADMLTQPLDIPVWT